MDEKTAIQATERKHPDQAVRAGRARRREFEYVRHGTAGLVAALDVHRGTVLARPIEANNSTTFCDFLELIDTEVDDALAIHVIVDNGSSHVSKQTKAWFADHPRWVVHYTPPHASWVNQIELFFSILQRKVVRNGNSASREDLVAKLLALHRRLRPHGQAIRLDLLRRPAQGGLMRSNYTRVIHARKH